MFRVRKAQLEDSQSIYQIRNDDNVLRYFFDSNKVSFDSHQSWYVSSLQNPLRKIYVTLEDETIVAVSRYDLKASGLEAEVSIYVATGYWGKGLGQKSLLDSEQLFKDEVPNCTRIIAKVIPENTSSVKLFEKCNYKAKFLELEKDI